MCDNPIISFNFHCFKCEEKFRVHLKYIKDKESIFCPNCGEKLPETVFNSLKQSASLLDESILALKLSNKYSKGWDFAIDWNESTPMPKRPSKYGDFNSDEKSIREYHKPFEY